MQAGVVVISDWHISRGFHEIPLILRPSVVRDFGTVDTCSMS